MVHAKREFDTTPTGIPPMATIASQEGKVNTDKIVSRMDNLTSRKCLNGTSFCYNKVGVVI